MAKIVEQEEPQFDWELYGMIIRKTRQRLGYKKADVFCESVFRRSRVNISPVTYYRIEQNNQEPTAIQLFGINMSLFGEPMPKKIFEACASDEWRDIESTHSCPDNQLFTPGAYEIPDSWRKWNFDSVCGDEPAKMTETQAEVKAGEPCDSGLFTSTYIPF